MARIPKLDSAGRFLAADVNAQIDARTKATMRADLPALAKELKIGGSGGGVYYDATGKAVKYVYVVSATDPGKTRVVDGETVEVWWVQTTPPDPMQSTPIGVTQDLKARSYTVPSDPVATYTVGGVLRTPGVYGIGTTEALTVTWSATPKPGYGFKAGAVTSGSLEYPSKTYASGDVVMSDSFNRADGPLVGTTSDSYAGGEPVTWGGTQGEIISGIIQPAPGQTSTGKNGFASIAIPSLTAIGLEFDLPGFPDASKTGNVALNRADGSRVQVVVFPGGGIEVHSNASGPNQKILQGVTSTATGQRFRLSTLDGKTWDMRNITTGAVATANPNATGYPFTTASPIVELAITMQAYSFTNARFDNLKVYVP